MGDQRNIDPRDLANLIANGGQNAQEELVSLTPGMSDEQRFNIVNSVLKSLRVHCLATSDHPYAVKVRARRDARQEAEQEAAPKP